MNQYRQFFHFILLSVAIFTSYSNTLQHGFHFDDILSKFNNEPFRDSFCRRGGGGCGRKKARFFNKISTVEFSSNSPYRVSTYNLSLSRSEHINGTEKEILIRRGYYSQRITIRIPPGLRDGTLLKVSLNEQNDYARQTEIIYLKIKHVNTE